jgi:hypothetical protein
MSDDLVKMCRRLAKYAHAQLSSADLDRIAAHIEAQAAEIARLRGELAWQDRAKAQHYFRRHMTAPEDSAVMSLCERYGYGAVIDAACRLWARKDTRGAFYVGGCIGLASDDDAQKLADRARAVLAALGEDG